MSKPTVLLLGVTGQLGNLIAEKLRSDKSISLRAGCDDENRSRKGSRVLACVYVSNSFRLNSRRTKIIYPGFARALAGNSVEALINAINEDEGLTAEGGGFLQVGGAYRVDFIGTGTFQGLSPEVTTEAEVAGHVGRPYLQSPGAMIFTYTDLLE